MRLHSSDGGIRLTPETLLDINRFATVSLEIRVKRDSRSACGRSNLPGLRLDIHGVEDHELGNACERIIVWSASGRSGAIIGVAEGRTRSAGPDDAGGVRVLSTGGRRRHGCWSLSL